MTRFSLAFLVALALALVPVAQAQTPMTEDEIADAFRKQKTRGLTLVPTTEETAAGSETAAPEGATEIAYQELPQDEQVNVSIRFDLDSAALREDQKPALVALCNVLKSDPVSTLRIVGHTDITGSAEYNERLSLLRAEEVKRYLASSDCGIADAQMEAVGVGSRFLLDGEKPKDAVNRRVEFQALS
ncbi:OmpA family protein [Pseudogemmobacter humi]|uniref:Outer membrane porin F n=1 Tax=Pseudogemmobacter humi TaxID=2483812 RepID=A0A3P5XEZ2_9RHOB|nr:OmpA family protein [Pseudogemmobacter humi]VDC33321.1 Outer membrane porin F precursor [Pseudogemmobacter humi]